jgi:hypothetical protein
MNYLFIFAISRVAHSNQIHYEQFGMTEAQTEEEMKFFRWIGEECNEEKLEELLASKTEDERKHLMGLVNYNGK